VPGSLRRILGVGFGLAVIIGSTLGIGILRTPGLVAGQLNTPRAILIAWIVGGLYTLLGSVCLTELGTMLPSAGGYYVYARRAFGDAVALPSGGPTGSATAPSSATSRSAWPNSLAVLVPSLGGVVRPIAVALLVAFVRPAVGRPCGVSSRFQEWATALKFFAFLALIVACLVSSASLAAQPGLSADMLPAAGPTLVGIVVALQSVVIHLRRVAERVVLHRRRPRSGAQPAEGDDWRRRPRDRAVPARECRAALGPAGARAARDRPCRPPTPRRPSSAGGAVRSSRYCRSSRCRRCVNAIMMIGTRIVFAMGRDRLIWSRTAAVNAGGTPGVATLVTTAVAIVLILTGTFQRLVATASFFLAANYAVCCLVLIVLRRREPELPRPFRAWGYPWSAYLVLIGAAVFLVGVLVGDPVNSAVALSLLAAGMAGRAVAIT
jgi:APA family basic amino acid/polyamine antiporter